MMDHQVLADVVSKLRDVHARDTEDSPTDQITGKAFIDLAEGMAGVMISIANDLNRIADAVENFNFHKVGDVMVATTKPVAPEEVDPDNDSEPT